MTVIKTIQVILAILFFTTTSITCTDTVSLKDKIEIVQLTAEKKIPILKVEIKGEKYVFLLDSQSPISFIDSTIVSKKNLKVNIVQPSDVILVTGDIHKTSKIVSIMNNVFYVHNFKRTKDNVRYHTGYSIDGIIGNDMIYNNRSSIDLKKAILDKLNDNKE